MIYLEDRHKNIIWNIIKKYPYTFYAFGSRTTGKHQQFSDLDIFINEPVIQRDFSDLIDAFKESNLPFTVDIVVRAHCKTDFYERIKKDFVLLNEQTLKVIHE